MKTRELRALVSEELKGKLQNLEKQLMELQFKRRTGVEKPHLFKQTKRERACILTILKERQK